MKLKDDTIINNKIIKFIIYTLKLQLKEMKIKFIIKNQLTLNTFFFLIYVKKSCSGVHL